MKNPLENVSIGIKLAFGFGVVLILTLIVASTGFMGVNTLLERANKVQHSNQMRQTVTELGNQRKLYLDTGSQGAYSNVLTLEDELSKQISHAKKLYVIGDDIKRVNSADQALKQYTHTFSKLHADRQEWVRTGKEASGVRNNLTEKADLMIKALSKDDNYMAMLTTLKVKNEIADTMLVITKNVGKNKPIPSDVINQRIPTIATDIQKLQLDGEAQTYQRDINQLFIQYRQLLNTNPDLTKKLTESSTQLLSYTKEITSNLQELREQQRQKSVHDGAKVRTLLITVTIGAIVMGAFFAWFIRHMIVTPMRDVTQAVSAIADGDLTHTYRTERRDELGKLYNDIGTMNVTLHTLISEVINGVLNLSSTSEQLENISHNSQNRMQSQRDETDQVATAINQMSATISEVARNANTAASATTTTDELVNQGSSMVNNTVTQISELATDLNNTSQTMAALKERSDNVGNVLEVIKAVAEQTNLLALNAAIEAARAGEAGRGFAVVADEVRGLASRTQKSAKEIEDLIHQLQNGAEESFNKIEASRDLSTRNADQAKDVMALFENISLEMGNVQDMTQQIATASEEQSQVSEDINSSIVNVRHLADETTEGAAESVTAVANLKALSLDLKSLTERFKTKS